MKQAFLEIIKKEEVRNITLNARSLTSAIEITSTEVADQLQKEW